MFHFNFNITISLVNIFQKELGVTLTPPSGKDKAEAWPGLQNVRDLEIKFEDKKRYFVYYFKKEIMFFLLMLAVLLEHIIMVGVSDYK